MHGCKRTFEYQLQDADNLCQSDGRQRERCQPKCADDCMQGTSRMSKHQQALLAASIGQCSASPTRTVQQQCVAASHVLQAAVPMLQLGCRGRSTSNVQHFWAWHWQT